MQLYNKKIISNFLFIFLFSNLAFLQNSPKAPVAPINPVTPIMPIADVNSTQMPSMPTISNTSNSNFQNQYKPGQKTSAKTTTQNKQPASSPTENSTIEQQKTNPLLSQLDGLTASDLFSLEGQGLFSNLSSLTKNQSNSTNQNLVLNQILTELNEIKTAQKNLSSTVSKQENLSESNSQILRFVINNQDILKSCKTIYFSKQEDNGSFLITGDAKTLFNSQVLQETFYMLFKTNGTQNGKSIFQVEVSLSQNFKTTESALYKFCSQTNLYAQKTGNLIVLRSSANNLTSDLLIDIGN